MWKKNAALLLILTLTSMLSPGCATIERPKTQGIPVTSSPAGATVIVNGVQQGVTPIIIMLARNGAGQVIRIESPGYNPVEIRPRRTFSSGKILLNLLAGFACAIPMICVYSLKHDWLEPGMGTVNYALLSTAALTGFFTAIDLGSQEGYEFKPKEITVTLTMADGTPRVDTMLIDAAHFQNVKWIRVRRD